MESTKYLIVIVGPTAIGKTGLAISLAQHFSTEIVSADSRQVFKQMNIGTAKPTVEEQNAAKHHLVDFVPINKLYTAGKFERDALDVIHEIHAKTDVAIMAGGSGLYVDAVCIGIDNIPSDLKIRERLNSQLSENGLDSLLEQLRKLDPEHFHIVDQANPQRVIRALEVCVASGRPYSAFRKKTPKNRPFTVVKVGLNADRELVYDRIERRVDLMLQAGLLDEVRSLFDYRNFNSLNTVGYKEFFPHLIGKARLEDCIDQLKKNTRNFAKRQLTWFKRDLSTLWVDAVNSDLKKDTIKLIDSRISEGN